MKIGYEGAYLWYMVYMGVSKNMGKPPKSSIFIGFSIINHPFWGTPIFGNTHIYIYNYIRMFMYLFSNINMDQYGLFNWYFQIAFMPLKQTPCEPGFTKSDPSAILPRCMGKQRLQPRKFLRTLSIWKTQTTKPILGETGGPPRKKKTLTFH